MTRIDTKRVTGFFDLN